MAASSAIRREVRWRVTGTTPWSDIQNCSPVAELRLEGLDRAKTYDVQVRDISACGAKSPWVMHTAVVPDVPAGNITLADLKTEADDAAAAAAAANAALALASSDNNWSPSEKSTTVVPDYNAIVAEQAGIDAQATAYGLTSQKTAYDAAVTALVNYVNTLTTPTDWNDLSGNTTIVGATARSKFADVYATRQALLNAIYAAAKAKADAAQGAADNAQGTANTAVGQVTQLPVINGGFDMTPTGYGWTADSGSGWTIDTAGNTPGVGPNCAAHVGGAGSGAFRNGGLAACQPGQVYKAQGLVKAVGANGNCYVYISWCNAGGAEIGSTPGNMVTGTTTAGSFAVGAAPAGTVYARTCIAATGHTAGVYYVDNVLCSQYPSSQDEVPDGTAFIRDAQQSTSEAVTNGNFQLAKSPDGSIPGWVAKDSTLNLSTAGPLIGTQSLSVVIAAGKLNAGVQSIKKYQCGAGDSFRVVANAYTNSGANPWVGLFYYDAADGFVGNGAAASSGGGWNQVVALSSPPAGAVYARLIAYQPGSSGGQFALVGVTLSRIRSIDTEVQDGTVYGRTSQNDLYVSGGVNRIGLRIAGSGHLIGDQRNLVSSITRNLGITRSATALTAKAGGSVDINAHTIQMGGASVSYSAKSNAVTGLATSASYYIYTRDNYAGGSPTWLAGTNQNTVNSYDDAYNAGVVTIPTSGTSGGGSGGGGISGCVAADMYLRHGLTAGQLAQRWRWWRPCLLRGQDGRHLVRRRPVVMPQPCCRITVADGSTLICSLSTPITVRTGESILAPMVYGHDLFTDSGWQRVIDVELLPGERDVVRISTGGHTFLAGAHPHLRISTHNSIKA